MQLTSQDLRPGQAVPGDFAFCIPDPTQRITLGKNLSPHLVWSAVPDGTRSFALICHDPDVPSRGDDVNQEGRRVPASLPRVDFFHWLLANLPAETRELPRGLFSSGVVAKGKPGPAAPLGAVQGINSYTQWFAGDASMAGNYYGYDGPCPPWNDELLHHYVFTLYALDVAQLSLPDAFDGPTLRAALQGHILAEASLTATYSLNPDVPA